MTYRQLYKLLQKKLDEKFDAYLALDKKIAKAKGFINLDEFLAFIKAEGEWLTAERQFLQYEAKIESNGVDLDAEIDIKVLYPYIDVKF